MKRWGPAVFFLGMAVLMAAGQMGGCRASREIKEPPQPFADRFEMESVWHRPDARVMIDSNSVVAICDTKHGRLLYITGSGGIATVGHACERR